MTFRVAMAGACPFPVPQGSQVLLRDVALGVAGLGHEVHLLVYPHGLGEDIRGLTVHRCRAVCPARRTAAGPSWSKIALDAAMAAALRRIVRTYRIDVVHAHNYEGLLVALAAGKRPIVYHAHNAMADELPYYFRGNVLARRVGGWLDRTFPRRADAVIAPHARLAEYLEGCGCSAARIRVIPPAADLELAALDVPHGTDPHVLYTGNLDAYQNLGLLRHAMALVRARRPGTRLVVATAAPLPIEGAEMTAAPDRDALRRVLAQDCVVAIPRVSWSGYPVKLLNAMAAGKAIVACSSAAPPLCDGENGLVVPDNDAEAFAAALMRGLDDAPLRTRLGMAARETALANHHPHAIAKAIEAVYRSSVKPLENS